MHYDISQPVDTVFNAIDDLADLAEHANSPMSAQQQIDLAYVIFARQSILQHDLRLWNRLPVVDRTWANMLEHFRTAQADLSALPTTADIYHQQPPHQANAVATMADLVAQRLLDAMPPPEEPLEERRELANAIHQRESDLQARETALHNQMQEMLALMRTSSNNSSTNRNRNRNPTQGRGRGRGNDRTNDRGRGRSANTRTNTRDYCWSHGACAHVGRDCNTPAPGHQADATFTDMRGGSTEACYWLPT
jgi:hypothetical protein